MNRNLRRTAAARTRKAPAPAVVPVVMPNVSAPVPAEIIDELRMLAARSAQSYAARNYEDAITDYRRIVQIMPGFSEAHSNLGVALFDLGRLSEAEDAFRQAIAANQDSAEAWSNLGYALQELGRNEDAIQALQRAVSLRQDYAEALSNLGHALHREGRSDEAEVALHKANAVSPDHARAHNNLAQVLLRKGDYAAGWPHYEWRWQAIGMNPPTYAVPVWDGSALDGKTILIYGEQGLGDTIQFARFVPQVAAMGGRVVLAVQRPLVELMRQLPATIIAVDEPLPAFDTHISLLSLPRVLGATLETIPAVVPYLSGQSDVARPFMPMLSTSGKLKVGVVWAGNPQHANDRNRSIPFSAFSRLFSVPGVQFVSLQVGRVDEPLYKHGTIDLFPFLSDFTDTAVAIDHLDLCICADTSVAHLAGAMGCELWVMLPHSPDWRWMMDRLDSPWYPSARLFRQTAAGHWDDVVERVADRLTRLASHGNFPADECRSGT